MYPAFVWGAHHMAVILTTYVAKGVNVGMGTKGRPSYVPDLLGAYDVTAMGQCKEAEFPPCGLGFGVPKLKLKLALRQRPWPFRPPQSFPPPSDYHQVRDNLVRSESVASLPHSILYSSKGKLF